jgi:hypothetical protein
MRQCAWIRRSSPKNRPAKEKMRWVMALRWDAVTQRTKVLPFPIFALVGPFATENRFRVKACRAARAAVVEQETTVQEEERVVASFALEAAPKARSLIQSPFACRVRRCVSIPTIPRTSRFRILSAAPVRNGDEAIG